MGDENYVQGDLLGEAGSPEILNQVTQMPPIVSLLVQPKCVESGEHINPSLAKTVFEYLSKDPENLDLNTTTILPIDKIAADLIKWQENLESYNRMITIKKDTELKLTVIFPKLRCFKNFYRDGQGTVTAELDKEALLAYQEYKKDIADKNEIERLRAKKLNTRRLFGPPSKNIPNKSGDEQLF